MDIPKRINTARVLVLVGCWARTRSLVLCAYSDRGKARLLLVHDIKDECIACFDTEEQR